MKYCWEGAAADFFFHYTEPAAAASITERELYVVGTGNLLGCGLYATTLVPTDHSAQALLRGVFMNLWPPLFVDGVVVLTRDTDLPFDHQGGDIWLHRAKQGDVIDLSGFVVGHGERTAAGWEFDPSLVI